MLISRSRSNVASSCGKLCSLFRCKSMNCSLYRQDSLGETVVSMLQLTLSSLTSSSSSQMLKQTKIRGGEINLKFHSFVWAQFVVRCELVFKYFRNIFNLLLKKSSIDTFIILSSSSLRIFPKRLSSLKASSLTRCKLEKL